MTDSADNSGPKFPPVIKINGRNYISRHDFEKYKAVVIAHALGGEEPPVVQFDGPDSLIPFRNVGAELGISRRTVARRWDASKSESAAA
jgi:hypothetical protein